MSNSNAPIVNKPSDRAEYIEAVDALARALYAGFPAAKFNRETLTTLATATQDGVSYDGLQAKAKMCIVRMSMAMIPQPAPVQASATVEDDAQEADDDKEDSKDKSSDETPPMETRSNSRGKHGPRGTRITTTDEAKTE